MTDFETRKEERRERFKAHIERRHGSGHIWTGVLLLLIGVVALAKSYVIGFPEWLFSWQMLLIVFGLFIGLRHKFHGAAWFVLLLVGGTFLVNDYFIDGDLRRHIWPVVLIAVGAFFIFRSRQTPGRHPWSGKTNDDGNQPDCPPGMFATNSQDDYIDTTSIFGGTKKNILTKDFKGGDVVNVFGGTELNLTQADINGTAVLELTTIFGGTKLVVPSHWTVKSEAVTIFGGIEDKRQLPPSLDQPQKVLLLKGTVIFGGIDIKSF
jgi:predicted membrane protein